MTDNPIFDAVVDGQNVPKDKFRASYLKMAVDLPNVAALQAMDTKGQSVFLIGTTFWRYDPADLTTPDDGVTCVIDASGARRYKSIPFTGIADGAVTNAKLSAVASGTIKGRLAAGTGPVSDLTLAAVSIALGVDDAAIAASVTRHLILP